MSAEQSYEKHAHHPVPTYIATGLTIVAVLNLVGAWWEFAWASRDLGMVCLALAVVVLVSISRTYTVRLQDRIILLEMKVRAAELLTPGQESALARLGTKQIVALRFASDAELPSLVDRVARENLTPDQIKRAIQQWRPDTLRT